MATVVAIAREETACSKTK